MAEVLPIRPRATSPPSRTKPPAPPKHLSASARKLWKDIMAGWHLDPAATSLLLAALECRDRYEAAAAEITRDGPTVVIDGKLRTHPAHTVARDNLREYRQIMRQLNLEVD